MEAIASRLDVIAIRSKKILGAPGLTTRNKKLLGTRKLTPPSEAGRASKKRELSCVLIGSYLSY